MVAVKELKERFPARVIFSACYIFNPAHYPDPTGTEELRYFSQRYGLPQLKTLLDHFDEDKVGKNGLQFPAIVDERRHLRSSKISSTFSSL